MHSPHPTSLLLAALAISCQSSEPSASPLTDGQAWSMTYEADAYSGTWQDFVSAETAPSAESAPPAESDPPAESEPSPEGEPATQGMVLLECRILQCPQEELARWTGKADATFALEAPADEILAFVARSRGDLVSAPKLLLHPGSKGSLSIADQVAFIEAFKVVQAGQGLIADPVVGIATEGLEVELTARPEGPAVRVDVLATYADVRLESSERELTLPGTQTPVTLQQPVTLLQRVETEGLLAEDRLLMIVAPASESGASLALFVSAKHVDQEGKLKGPDESARLWPRTTPMVVPPTE